MRERCAAWWLAIRIDAASSNALATRPTALVTFVVSPALSVVFLVSLSSAMGSADIVTTAYAAVLINSVLVVTLAMATSMTRDRQLGLIHETLGRCVYRLRFWIPRAIVPSGATCVSTTATVGCILALDPHHQIHVAVACLTLLPVAMAVGMGLGVFCSGLALTMRDPYLVANLVSGLLVLTSGVVAPLASYPRWAYLVCRYLPGSGMVAALRSAADGHWDRFVGGIACDVVGAIVVASTGIGGAVVALSAVRRGRRPIDAF